MNPIFRNSIGGPVREPVFRKEKTLFGEERLKSVPKALKRCRITSFYKFIHNLVDKLSMYELMSFV
jgi:hypothetical protein